MTTFIIITGLSYLIALILFFVKPRMDSHQKTLKSVYLIIVSLFIVTLILLFNGYRLSGQYTNTIIGQTYLSATILLFVLIKSKTLKIYAGLIAVLPFLIIPSLFAYLMFAPPITKEKINGQYNLETHPGGIMGCGQILYMTRNTFIFDKQIYLSSNNCITSIYKLEIITFKENAFLIYKAYHHDKEDKYLANPFVDTLDLKNKVW